MYVAQMIVRRVLLMVPILLGVTLVTFLLTQVIPSDPAVALAGDTASDEAIEAIRERLGLDEPIWMQYLNYLGRLLSGDLGTSIYSQRAVASEIALFLPATIELATTGIIIALALGGTLGILAAVHRGRFPDQFGRLFAIFGASVPVFWLGLLLVLVFYSVLGWFPGGGRSDNAVPQPERWTGFLLTDSLLQGNLAAFGDGLMHLALPAITLGIMGAGSIARVMRAGMLDVLSQEYIRAAKAKGLGRRRVLYVHGVRNALLPTITVAGIVYGALLGGAVLTESIFSWPGLGRYAVDAMFRQDFPALMAVVIVIAIAYAIVNLIVDILYTILNPTLR
ncbi:ABC transporter permease [Agromyces aerolatus]|uniref:ABC transporter permease n=1 Tax=Agromyces sp. LY-1074 TaxID=3074080 RepID=UPI002857C537|nr:MULTISPECIES: ABC transporter permease [unclassified Agromyces]MDR5700849.1 ABC transporter permease [Agromyces sp. LY-1074]MDR5707490.1 ABC transporter permease [Agromyces sp. LY-1358]